MLRHSNRVKALKTAWRVRLHMHRKCQSFFSPPAGGGTRKRCWLTLSFNNSQVFMTVSINENKPFAHSNGQDWKSPSTLCLLEVSWTVGIYELCPWVSFQ